MACMVLQHCVVRLLIRGPCGDLMYTVDGYGLAANPTFEMGSRLSPNAAGKWRGWYSCRHAFY
jgi:hypothetical protein